MTSPTGVTFGQATNVVIDANGMSVAPQRPYTLLESWERAFVAEWESVEAMGASIQASPPPGGLPDGAPNPNSVFREEGTGKLCRYVVDPDVARDKFVQQTDDGHEEVRERTAFRLQYVALSLAAAREATDRRNVDRGDPETDFWCGYTWIRGGYSPERWAPVAVQMQTQGKPSLVFDQPASPSDVARLRHEISRLDRTTAPMPIEAAAPQKRPRKAIATPSDTTAAGAQAPAED